MNPHRASVLLAMLAFVVPTMGRFVFTPILPLMQADYGLSIVVGGWLAAANHFGYLLGAVTATRTGLTERTALRAGILIVTLTFLPMMADIGVGAWLAVRFVAGIGAAWVLIHASAWGLRHALAAQRPDWSGWIFAGAGLALIGSGVICALWSRAGGHAPGAWLLCGGVLGGIAVVLWPRAGEHHIVTAPASGPAAPAAGTAMHRLVLAYGLGGFGYVTAATFLPVLAKGVLGAESGFAWFWPMFGVAALVFTLWIARLSGKLDDAVALRVCMSAMAAGNIVMAVLDGGWALFLGTVAVGGTFMSLTMLGLREVRRRAPQSATRLIGRMTIAWAVGQCVGPVVSAYLAGADGRFTGALLLSGSALLLGALLVPGRAVR